MVWENSRDSLSNIFKAYCAMSIQRLKPPPKLHRTSLMLVGFPHDENRQYPTQIFVAKHGISSGNLLQQRVFYLPMVELGHIPCRHMVKEYEGFLCTLASFLTIATSQTILTQCYSLFLQSNLHKGSHEEIPYLVHKPITLHFTKEGPLRLPTMVKRIAQ